MRRRGKHDGGNPNGERPCALHAARATKRPTRALSPPAPPARREENVCRHKETCGTYISNVTTADPRENLLGDTRFHFKSGEKGRAARKERRGCRRGGGRGETKVYFIICAAAEVAPRLHPPPLSHPPPPGRWTTGKYFMPERPLKSDRYGNRLRRISRLTSVISRATQAGYARTDRSADFFPGRPVDFAP